MCCWAFALNLFVNVFNKFALLLNHMIMIENCSHQSMQWISVQNYMVCEMYAFGINWMVISTMKIIEANERAMAKNTKKIVFPLHSLSNKLNLWQFCIFLSSVKYVDKYELEYLYLSLQSKNASKHHAVYYFNSTEAKILLQFNGF